MQCRSYYFNGSVRTIEHTNLAYVEPHTIIIKDESFGKKEERKQYIDVVYELYNKDIINTKGFEEMYDIYEEIENYGNNRGNWMILNYKVINFNESVL